MKELQRLVRIIDKLSPASSPLINLQDSSTLEAKLFNLLNDEAVLSDEVVAMELYGDEKLSGSYRSLKSRFRRKLYNHLHFIQLDEQRFSSYSIAIQQCLALLQEGNTLVQLSEQRMAEKVFDQLLDIAEKNELTEYAVKALEYKQILATNQGNVQKYKTQDILLQNAYDKRNREREAVRTYQLLMVRQRSSVQSRESNLHLYPETLQGLRASWQETGLSSIYQFYHILRVQYSELTGNYREVSEAVAETETLFETGKLNKSWYNKKFNVFIGLYALLQTRQYKEGKRFASDNLKYFLPFSANWFAFMENYLLLALHDRDYILAKKLLEECFFEEHYTKISNIIRERLEVIRRYMVLLQSNLPDPVLVPYNKTFEEELHILPKDKSGFNLALLVLDVLEKLIDRGVDDLEVQAERVRKYIQKYLRGEKAERPRLFMRLLLLVLTKQSAAAAREQGENLLEKLKTTPLPGDAFTEVEIVPYEHLWELALQLLQRREQLL